MEQKPKRTRNISLLNLFSPNPPNSFLSSTTYHSYRPDPMFKYMKSPLSQRTRTMLEELFIPSKILHLTNKSTKYYPTDIYKQPIKIMKIEYKLNTSRTKHNKHINTTSTTNKSQIHPFKLHSHLKTNSHPFFPNNTSKSQYKPIFPSHKHKHLSYHANCLSERNIKSNHIHNQTYSHYTKRQHIHISKSPIKQILPLSLLNKTNSEQTLFHNNKHKHNKSFSLLKPFPNEDNTSMMSIIDDYSCKIFNTSKPKAVHFALTNIFHIPSFAVFGICHGSGPNAFVVATTASHYFTFAFTNEYTYYSSNSDNSHITCDVIEKMFTDNNYKLIYSIGKEVDIAVRKSLPLNNKCNYNLSYGIAIVIKNNVIHVNRGTKIENVTLIEDIVDEVEMINSMKHCKGMIKQKENDFTYEHIRYNHKMKYIILCSAKIVNSFCWKNILKIICDAYKNDKVGEYKEKQLLSLMNKIEKIYKYITRIYGVNAHTNGNGGNRIKHVNCFALLLAKCIG